MSISTVVRDLQHQRNEVVHTTSSGYTIVAMQAPLFLQEVGTQTGGKHFELR